MHLRHQEVGDFRIYTAATPTGQGDYIAAVSVQRWRGVPHASRIVFSDFALGNGFRFKSPQAALRYAFEVAYRAIDDLMSAP